MPTTIEPPRQLPLQPFSNQDWSEYGHAYDIVLNAECHAMKLPDAIPPVQRENNNLIFARVTGFLLIELFDKRAILSVEPCRALAFMIVSPPLAGTTTNDLVVGLGRRYYDLYIHRTFTMSCCAPSPPLSHSSFDNIESMTAQFMKSDNKGYKATELKALARDGFRCMVTGGFDNECILKNRELDEKCEEELGIATGVQAYQIFGKSLMQDFGENQGEHASTVISVLKHFGLGSLADKLLEADGVHVGNLLSLSCDMGFQFEHLCLWFEATDTLDCYNVCVSTTALKRHLTRSGYLRQDGNRLLATFSSHNTDAPLPDRQFLTLHAVCARVAHMSGAIQIIDKSELDAEDTKVLASDGLSADLLDHHMAFAAAPEVL